MIPLKNLACYSMTNADHSSQYLILCAMKSANKKASKICHIGTKLQTEKATLDFCVYIVYRISNFEAFHWNLKPSDKNPEIWEE